MPFPWKKVRSTKISQLVNDHLHQSQKRRDGSSLVVATGFPTSLIDLIIKNREKLNKQSRRKRQNPVSDANDSSITGSPPSSPSPPPPPPPSITGSPLNSPSPPPSIAGTPIPTNSPLPPENLSVLPLPSISVSEISVVGGNERGADYRVFLGVLKMFLVVVCALGTKRLTIGITLSAFLLLFLEYLGKYATRFSNKGVIRSIVRSVLRVLRFKKIRLDRKKDEILMNPGSSYRYRDQEIQVVEEIQPVNEIMEEPDFENQEIKSMEKEELICDVLESEYKRTSRRARIKSKMKKLVPKKFKTSRKEIGLQTTQSASYEEQSERDEFEIASESSSISCGRYIEDDAMREISRLDDAMREEKVLEFEGGLTWRHLVVCLIVLTGLIGGRGFALALTLSWFLLLKLGEMLSRYLILSCN